MGNSAVSRCWFTKLSTAQVVALAAAVGMTGCDLVTRLHAHPMTAPFGLTYKAPVTVHLGEHLGDRPFQVATSEDPGVSMQTLQTMCHARGLPVSGTRFELVLALLTHDAAAAREAQAKKRRKSKAAQSPETAQTTVEKPKRRRRVA